jgi:MraZ protein
MALTGTYERSLDEKLRIAVPKRLRDEFGEGELTFLYAAPGADRCVALYSPAGFDRFAQKIEQQPAYRTDVRNYMRLFYAQAEKLDLDSQGRVRLPDRLATMAGLQREVVIVGVHDRAEIWDSTTWKDYLARLTPDFDAIATQVFSGANGP